MQAPPEVVWEAIATGPGLDSWFMGRNEIEPREGGKARTVATGWTAEATVTAWDPPNRFAYRSDEEEDGSFHAFEYVIDRPQRGNTTVRWLHTGFLGGDNRQAECEAMNIVHTARILVDFFQGRVLDDFRNNSRNLPESVGLSMGLDAGPGYLVEIASELTVVGSPVVGAVRMVTAAARPGEIIPNVFLGERLREEQDGVYENLGVKVTREHRPTKEYPGGQEVYALTFDGGPAVSEGSSEPHDEVTESDNGRA